MTRGANGRFPKGNGAGWGGQAKGASTSRIRKGDPDGIQARAHLPEVTAAREARIAALKDKLFDLANHAEREETQLAATVAYLNREEGMPVARNITANVDDVSKVVIVTGVPRADDDRTVN